MPCRTRPTATGYPNHNLVNLHQITYNFIVLLIDFDPFRLWEGLDNIDVGTRGDRFFIKPYNMSIDELTLYRDRFDNLYTQGKHSGDGFH